MPNFGLPEASGDGLDGTFDFAEELSYGFELGRQLGHDSTWKRKSMIGQNKLSVLIKQNFKSIR